jgi:hypothetical protein
MGESHVGLAGGVGDFTHEPISATGYRLDEVTILPKRLAYRRDLELERILLDDGFGPDLAQKLVFCDEFAPSLDQDQQYIERSAADGDSGPLSEKLASAGIETKAAKLQTARVVPLNRGLLHVSLSNQQHVVVSLYENPGFGRPAKH